MIQNFGWLLPGRLAGFGAVQSLDPADMRFLSQQGVGALVSLTEDPVLPLGSPEPPLRYQHLPVEDMTPPSLGQMQRFVRFVDEAAAAGLATAVHCRAGLGRTGTMLAAYLIHQGIPWDEAVERVRRRRPGSVETPAQEEALMAFARGTQVPAPRS